LNPDPGEPNHALVDAIERCDKSAASLAVDAGADVNLCGADGEPMIVRASVLGCSDIIRLLLDGGCVVDQVDERGWSALMLIVTLDSPHDVELLLAHGADPNRESGQDSIVSRPIFQCVFAGESKPDTLRLLLRYGADPLILTPEGNSPLDLASDVMKAILIDNM